MTDDIPELNFSRGCSERDGSDGDDGDDGAFSFAGDDAAPDSEADATPAEPDATDEVLPEDVSELDDDEIKSVKLLVQLTKKGTIDLWGTDIVEVTDAFLNRLDAMDLRTTGRMLFHASVLPRTKSGELLAPDKPDEEELEPRELALEGNDDEGHPGNDGEGPPGFDLIDALEDEMDRQPEHKHARRLPEMLDKLARELREVEHGLWWKRRREYGTSESPRGFSCGMQTLDYHAPGEMHGAGEPTEDDVIGTAHNEGTKAVVGVVGDVLATHYEKDHDEVLLAEIRDVAGTVVATYLALLSLSHRNTAYLKQDGLFGDLWIQNPEMFDADPGAESNANADVEVADDADAKMAGGGDDADDTDSDDPELEAEAIVDD